MQCSNLGDWITRQRDEVKQGIGGADDRLVAALELETVAEGAATIFTPDFALEIALTLDESDPTQAILRWEMVNITNPELVYSDALNRAFERAFSIIEFEYSDPFDIAGMIDRLEDAADDRIHLDYSADASFCRLNVQGLQFSIVVTSEKVTLEYEGLGSPRFLLEGLKEANQFMLVEHEVLLLTN